jgi:hypothetical protein
LRLLQETAVRGFIVRVTPMPLVVPQAITGGEKLNKWSVEIVFTADYIDFSKRLGPDRSCYCNDRFSYLFI